jgi:hypothetical protein
VEEERRAVKQKEEDLMLEVCIFVAACTCVFVCMGVWVFVCMTYIV